MITPYKKRKIDAEKPVRVYRNLRGDGLYSVCQGGRVVAHATDLKLSNCQLIISRSGQRRVRATGRKNVHAWVRGYVAKQLNFPFDFRLTYDPYRNDHFVATDPHKPFNYPVNAAAGVWITPKGVFATAAYFELA